MSPRFMFTRSMPSDSKWPSMEPILSLVPTPSVEVTSAGSERPVKMKQSREAANSVKDLGAVGYARKGADSVLDSIEGLPVYAGGKIGLATRHVAPPFCKAEYTATQLSVNPEEGRGTV